mgnify:FL=1
MQTALTMNGRSIDIAPGFRERVWLLLLEYFDYLQILDDPIDQEPIDWTKQGRICEDYSEAKENLYNAAHAIEKEFLRLGLMRYWPLETVGITLIHLRLDEQEMYVRTLSMHWWRFVFEQLSLPFPLILEMIPVHDLESHFESG